MRKCTSADDPGRIQVDVYLAYEKINNNLEMIAE
jgi:hypothetical protein